MDSTSPLFLRDGVEIDLRNNSRFYHSVMSAIMSIRHSFRIVSCFITSPTVIGADAAFVFSINISPALLAFDIQVNSNHPRTCQRFTGEWMSYVGLLSPDRSLGLESALGEAESFL